MCVHTPFLEEAIIHLPLFQQDRSLSFVSLGYSPPIQQTRYVSILLFHLTQYRIEIMAAAELYSITLFSRFNNHPPLPYAAAVSLYKNPPN